MHTGLAGFREENGSPTQADERFGLLSSFLLLEGSFVLMLAEKTNILFAGDIAFNLHMILSFHLF